MNNAFGSAKFRGNLADSNFAEGHEPAIRPGAALMSARRRTFPGCHRRD
jgi:hypothetical protein